MSSVHGGRRPLAQEPGLTWFLRVGTLDRVLMATASAALVVQAVITASTDRDPVTSAALVVGGAGLAIGTRRRSIGLGLTVLAACVAALAWGDYIALWTVAVMMLLSVTVRGTGWFPAGVLSTLAVYMAVVMREDEGFGSGPALLAASLCISATAIGCAVRSQAKYLDAMRERALEAVATRDLAVERGVARERLRIAQDLHDTVGHEIAVVGMGLSAAEVKIETDPDAARAALLGARQGVQRVLRETQQILDILRHGAGAGTGAEVEAVADAHHIGTLVDALRAASVPVDAELPDTLPALDPAVSAAAYRITQEALTNAQRHGTGGIRFAARVAGDQFILTIENERSSVREQCSQVSGYGLIGMRERADSVGARLAIEDTPRRFVVTAALDIAQRRAPA